MRSWTEQGGSIVANRSWVMSEAWAIIGRFKKRGQQKPLSDAMRLAWFNANMEVDVQLRVRRNMNNLKRLDGLSVDQLRDMADNIDNIDRQSDAQKRLLSDIHARIRCS